MAEVAQLAARPFLVASSRFKVNSGLIRVRTEIPIQGYGLHLANVFFVLLYLQICAACADLSTWVSESDFILPRRQGAKFGKIVFFPCVFPSLREMIPGLVAALRRRVLRVLVL
jgi:hypothetical protein